MSKTIVVLGAGIGGLHIAHYLLSATLKQIPELQVILVAPNEEFYVSRDIPFQVPPTATIRGKGGKDNR